MNPITILIVEDERIIAKGLEKRLKGLGYAVVGMASTGEEGIQKATELRPDLVLMDIHLGAGVDGVEAAGVIRGRVCLPVVFLTAHSDDATIQRAKLTEPFGYVLKPYEDSDLQTAIEIGLYKHKMERRLRENEQWLAATLGSIGDGVIATDELGRVRFMNSLAERMTGSTQVEALGKELEQIYRIVDDKARQPVRNPLREALDKGEMATLNKSTILLNTEGSAYPIEASAAPIRDVTGKLAGGVLVFRDITERARLEEHQRQTQKMEAIGRLAGGIAHDFNNIMTIITGFSELLLTDSFPAAERRGMVEGIHEAGMRAASLTQQIMAFGRKQMLMPYELNLNTVVRDMVPMVKRLLGSHIEFVTETAPDLGQVKADPTQLGQMILNLAANASDAMPGPRGGRLMITTANGELNESITRSHPDLKPGRCAVISITDTGRGMSAEVLAKVFEPFFTTKEFGEGTGLGLATVYGIVKQSGGHIDVASKVGIGTTFRVYLPLIEEQTPAIAPNVRPTAMGHETVLLLEEDAMVGRMTRKILEQDGYTVVEASNGSEALRMAEAHGGTIHLLMTDLVMAQQSGRQTVERLRAMVPGLRVLFTYGNSEEMVGKESESSACAYYLQKPYGLSAMRKKVREILDEDQPGR